MDEQKNNYIALAKTLHKIEEAKRKLDYEVGTLISQNGKVIKEYIGEAHKLRILVSELPLFAGNIFTHNHPGGRTFTQEDIINFAETEAIETRVPTPRGAYFSLKVLGGENNRSIGRIMWEEQIGSYNRACLIIQEGAAERKYSKSIFSQKKEHDKLAYDIMAEDVDKWLTENAEEFGFIYKKGNI